MYPAHKGDFISLRTMATIWKALQLNRIIYDMNASTFSQFGPPGHKKVTHKRADKDYIGNT